MVLAVPWWAQQASIDCLENENVGTCSCSTHCDKAAVSWPETGSTLVQIFCEAKRNSITDEGRACELGLFF